MNEIKIKIHQAIEELFAHAATDELTGDAEACADKLDKIAIIAGLLGVGVEVTIYSLDLRE